MDTKNNYYGFIFKNTLIKVPMFECIKEWEYGDNYDIVLVVIPNSVITIEKFAFACCKNLTTVIIPDSVKNIENNAFNGCSNLTIYTTKNSYAHQYAQQNNIKYVIQDIEDVNKNHVITDEKKELWELMFKKIQNYDGYNYASNENVLYRSVKAKILSGYSDIINAEEFKNLKNAIVTAEHFANIGRYQLDAYVLRRILYHSKEEGLDEFAMLKDKFGGCYIATAVYGSYDHPSVHVLRNFRDDFLEKRRWGQIFVTIYYKYSPYLAKKLKSKNKTNAIIKYILDRLIFKMDYWCK